jgi:hypothetical protein
MSLQVEERLQRLWKEASEYEYRARKRAVIYSVIPIALACLLIVITGSQIGKMQQELKTLRIERDNLKADVDVQRKQMRFAANLLQYKYDGNPLYFIKDNASNPHLQEQVRLLEKIIELDSDDVGWKLGGKSPEEGFDSPNFAAYLLERYTKFELSSNSSSALQQLEKAFPVTPVPKTGDLVIYPNGYTMFYFALEDDQAINRSDHSRSDSFVIGMTPLGILTLRPDFDRPVSYHRVFSSFPAY